MLYAVIGAYFIVSLLWRFIRLKVEYMPLMALYDYATDSFEQKGTERGIRMKPFGAVSGSV